MLSYVSCLGCWPSSSSWADQQSLKQMLWSWLGGASRDVPIPSYTNLHPGSGRFCPQVRCFPKPKRRTCDRIEPVSTLPESIRLVASDGSKVLTWPHLVPERRGYSFNICVAPRCETHMRFKPYTFSYVFIINGLTPWCRRPPHQGGG